MSKQRTARDPGTGTQYNYNSKRVINKDGSFNVRKVGLNASTRNAYQSLIQMSWTKFFLLAFSFLLLVNMLFGAIYTLVEIKNLENDSSENVIGHFLHACYFSFQTFTTVGYGNYYPAGHLSNTISALESVLGWMCFALITGILYGRFSKPSARLLYSKKAIVAPYKNGLMSLQFRIANMRNSMLMEMEATVLLMIVDKSKKSWRREFKPLSLERDFILFFPLTWTIVHPIDEKSPLYGKAQKELENIEMELMIRIKGYDDTFAQTVHSRYSYKIDEIVWGARYVQAFDVDNNGDVQLHFDKIHDHEKISLS